MTDYINLQVRCQRGEPSLAGANNLLAECHAALGKLMAENKRLESAVNQSLNLDFERRHEIEQLKSDNESMKGQIDRLDKLDTLQIIAEQAKHIEALRKELGSRQPFKFSDGPAMTFAGCVICGVYTDHGGMPCPTRSSMAANLRDAIKEINKP